MQFAPIDATLASEFRDNAVGKRESLGEPTQLAFRENILPATLRHSDTVIPCR